MLGGKKRYRAELRSATKGGKERDKLKKPHNLPEEKEQCKKTKLSSTMYSGKRQGDDNRIRVPK